MRIEGGSSQVNFTDDKGKKAEKPAEKQTQTTVSPLESTDNFKRSSGSEKRENAIAFTVINRNQYRETTYGVRVEREIPIIEGNVLALSAIGGKNINFAQHSFNIEPGVGVKLAITGGKVAGLYTTVMGTANVGVLDGRLTAGVGGRGAVGGEIGPLYGEYFVDLSTNQKSHGFAGGVRVKF